MPAGLAGHQRKFSAHFSLPFQYLLTFTCLSERNSFSVLSFALSASDRDYGASQSTFFVVCNRHFLSFVIHDAWVTFLVGQRGSRRHSMMSANVIMCRLRSRHHAFHVHFLCINRRANNAC